MEARLFRAAILCGALVSLGANYRTPNFVVSAPTETIAKQVGDTAEKCRRELAIEWLGKEMPKWAQPCPITAQVGDHLGAGGATSLVFDHGEVFGWQMNIQGPLDRMLDSVLPHEVTHTIFACHFRRPLPRWADEGACSTVEDPSERAKQQRMLIAFLQTNRGIAFSQMFAMKEYPRDILPLYAQGHSLATFLLAQGGKKKYLEFVGKGMESERWSEVTREYYNFSNLGDLQNAWLAWVRKGSPAMNEAEPKTLLASNNAPAPAPTPVTNAGYSGQREASAVPLPGPLVPVQRDASAAEVAQGSTGWRAAGTCTKNAAPAQVVANESGPPAPTPSSGPVVNAVTRPQPVEHARQVILEWQRQASPPAVPAASPQPAMAAAVPPTEPGRSVYDVRAPRNDVIRR
jgi:hypothetical protein